MPYVWSGAVNDSGTGSEIDPWKTLPDTATSPAHTTTAGDVVRVFGGSSFAPTVANRLVTVSGVSYVGHSTAGTPFEFRQPDPGSSTGYTTKTPFGGKTWTIDGSGLTAASTILTGTRSDILLADCEVIGPPAGIGIDIGNSTSPGQRIKLRNVYIRNCGTAGIRQWSKNVEAEWLRIENCGEDLIILRDGSFNSDGVGSIDRYTHLDLREPNYNLGTGAVDGTLGDAFQMFSSSASGSWVSGREVYLKDVYVKKTGTAKQAFLFLVGSAGRITLDGFYLDGGDSGGAASILLAHCTAGRLTIKNGAARNWSKTKFGFLRFDAANSGAPAYGWGTGSNITIDGVHLFGSYSANLLAATWNLSAGPFEHDGNITVRNCTINGVNADDKTDVGATSMAATFGFDSARTTYGTNFRFVAENNLCTQTGAPHITMPSGTAGSNKWTLNTNVFAPSCGYKISTTSYADIAAFEAAHDDCTNGSEMSDAAALLTDGVPSTSSPVYEAGLHRSYRLDAAGFLRRNPPSVGAFEAR